MEVKESWGKVNLVAAINIVLFVYVSFCVIFCKGEWGCWVFLVILIGIISLYGLQVILLSNHNHQNSLRVFFNLSFMSASRGWFWHLYYRSDSSTPRPIKYQSILIIKSSKTVVYKLFSRLKNNTILTLWAAIYLII